MSTSPFNSMNGTHVVDVLGNTKGRDQPIMLISKALELVSMLEKDVITSDNFVLFDPFCKAGEILLASAMVRIWLNLDKRKPIDISVIKHELYGSNRYFGLSPDERHYRLSLRTFLGNEKSHQEQYTSIIKNGNYLSEVDGCLDSTKFKQELSLMIEHIKTKQKNKKIIAIGNPPYQESDGGFGKSAANIYQYFANQLFTNTDINKILLVIPSRWFGGGKGLDDFRKTMLHTTHLKKIVNFQNANQVFPTVDINGGVCFIYIDKEHDGKTLFSDGKNDTEVALSEFDIIPDDPNAYAIVKKIKAKWKNHYVGDIAWARKPFGLSTDYFIKNEESNPKSKSSIPCLSRNKTIKYVDKKFISKNIDKLNLWKVSVPNAVGGSKGKRRSTIPLNQILLIEPGMITTETYNIIDTFNKEELAENFIQYIKTDFVRYLVGLRKITQHLPRDRWNWVPYLDMSKKWSNQEIYDLFGITKQEAIYINNKLQEWS